MESLMGPSFKGSGLAQHNMKAMHSQFEAGKRFEFKVTVSPDKDQFVASSNTVVTVHAVFNNCCGDPRRTKLSLYNMDEVIADDWGIRIPSPLWQTSIGKDLDFSTAIKADDCPRDTEHVWGFLDPKHVAGLETQQAFAMEGCESDAMFYVHRPANFSRAPVLDIVQAIPVDDQQATHCLFPPSLLGCVGRSRFTRYTNKMMPELQVGSRRPQHTHKLHVQRVMLKHFVEMVLRHKVIAEGCHGTPPKWLREHTAAQFKMCTGYEAAPGHVSTPGHDDKLFNISVGEPLGMNEWPRLYSGGFNLKNPETLTRVKQLLREGWWREPKQSVVNLLMTLKESAKRLKVGRTPEHEAALAMLAEASAPGDGPIMAPWVLHSIEQICAVLCRTNKRMMVEDAAGATGEDTTEALAVFDREREEKAAVKRQRQEAQQAKRRRQWEAKREGEREVEREVERRTTELLKKHGDDVNGIQMVLKEQRVQLQQLMQQAQQQMQQAMAFYAAPCRPLSTGTLEHQSGLAKSRSDNAMGFDSSNLNRLGEQTGAQSALRRTTKLDHYASLFL